MSKKIKKETTDRNQSCGYSSGYDVLEDRALKKVVENRIEREKQELNTKENKSMP
jgi:hypothetical protein